MSLWVIVGGQYGGEGKGKIAAFITQQEAIDICIRCGGPNSGHSFVGPDGTVNLLRQLPTGYVRPETRLLIPAGGLIDLEVLKSEFDAFRLDSRRVGVDRNAMVIEESDKTRESNLQMRQRLSSTLCGVGSAVARRTLRGTDVRLASDAARQIAWLNPLITDVSEEANSGLDRGKSVLVEGTQGSGLSLYHASAYPKATSRDTLAASFLSEAGLSPVLVTEIVVVFRTFPIRVAGAQAGPLKEEIGWHDVQYESGCPHLLEEMTTVTKKVRRVGRFDWELAECAVRLNRPTKVAINGLDYLDFRDRGVHSRALFSARSDSFITALERRLHVPVSYFGVGPALSDVIKAGPDGDEPEIQRGECEPAFNRVDE